MPIDFFLHPNDKTPHGFWGGAYDVVGKAGWFAAKIDKLNAKIIQSINLPSKIRVDACCKQFKRQRRLLHDCCLKLGMFDTDLYVDVSKTLSIRAYGDAEPCGVVSSALLDKLSTTELQALFARECAHILCRHVRLFGICQEVLENTDSIVDIMKWIEPLLSIFDLGEGMKVGVKFSMKNMGNAIKEPYLKYRVFAEYTADRMASYVMGDPHVVVNAVAKSEGIDAASTGALMEQLEKSAEKRKPESTEADEMATRILEADPFASYSFEARMQRLNLKVSQETCACDEDDEATIAQQRLDILLQENPRKARKYGFLAG